MDSHRYLVVYRRPNEDCEMQVVTTDVVGTVAMLEAQGYIIIDIIDIG